MTRIITIILCAAALFGQVRDTYPRTIGAYTVASLPTPAANSIAIVTDGASASDCTVGGGSTRALCAYSGSAWVSIGGSGTSVTAGTGIGVAGSTVSIDDTVTATRAQVQSGADSTCVDSGGDDAYACALTPPLGSYTTGMRLSLKVSTTNTGAATVDAGPGAKTIKTASGATLADGDIVAGAAMQIAYDGTDFRLVGSSAAAGASSNFLPITWVDDTSWTAYGSAMTYSRGSNYTSAISSGGSGVEGRMFSVGSTFSYIFLIHNSQTDDDTAIGVFFSDGTKASTCGLVFQSASQQRVQQGYNWNSSSSFSGAVTYTTGPQQTWKFASTGYTYYRVSRDATNMTCEYSFDGYRFTQMWTVTTGTFLTPTHVGYFGRDGGSTNKFEVLYRGRQ